MARRERDVERERFARSHVDALAPRVPRLRVRAAPGGDPPTIRVDDAPLPPSAWGDELPLDPQHLSLELQRSLDYYESHFDETAIAELYMAPAGMRANLLAAELGASTGLRISMYNIHDLIDVSFSAEIPDGWLPCMAIGAALRQRKG